MNDERIGSSNIAACVDNRLNALADRQVTSNAPSKGSAESLTRIEDRVQLLATRFSLSDLEAELLFVLAAHEQHPDFRERFAVLAQGSGLSGIQYSDLATYFSGRLEELDSIFTGASPVFAWELLRSHDPGGEPVHGPFYLDARIRAFLSGSKSFDARVNQHLQTLGKRESLRSMYLKQALRSNTQELLDYWQTSGVWRYAAFLGPAGCGQVEAAEWIATQLGLPAFHLDLTDSSFETARVAERVLLLGLREAALAGALLLVTGLRNDESQTAALSGALNLAAKWRIPLVVSIDARIIPLTWLRKKPQQLQFTLQTVDARGAFWEDVLAGGDLASDVSAGALAARYRLSQDRIIGAAQLAETAAMLRRTSGVSPQLRMSDFAEACRALSQTGLRRLAKKIESMFSWKDLVLQDDIIRHLQQLTAHVRNRDRVYESWKYSGSHTAASGVHALFSGPPGTGKTMAASIIANDLGLELFRIDLATVVSKYIGETEKNLSRIFDEAQSSNAILFFDEADALFGKRSEVKDARDRYANIEVSYLLQKIEEYDGLTILASNMIGNLDNAFRRRLHYIVEFYEPNERERERLWRMAITPETPIDETIDYALLAGKLKISAAGIKSIVLRAALFAADQETNLGMSHIIEAVRREFQKEDRTFLETDFTR